MNAEQLLGQLEGKTEVVVADFEAGLGTLSRMEAGEVDQILVMVEPTAKSIEVARRALDMIEERKLGLPIVVANRIQTAPDHATISRAFPGRRLVTVPDDPAIRQADEEGRAPFDAASEAPAVRALRDLAGSLVEAAA